MRTVFRRNRALNGSHGSPLHNGVKEVGYNSRGIITSNPITAGLILYIVFLHLMSLLNSKNDDSSITASLTARTINPVGSSSEKGVGVFPRRLPVLPTNPVQWKPFSSQKIKLPYPIFVPSLPKSGTTSVWKFFKCGQQLSSHNWIQKRDTSRSTLVGECIEENMLAGRPPFEDCGDVDVYTDTGYLTYDHDHGEKCFYPSIDGLEAIYASYPNASFVNVIRDSETWYTSLRDWSSSSLFVRLRLCNATGFPNGQSTKADFIKMYDGHNEMIRQFCKDRPSLTCLEFKLESPETGRLLADATGIDATCWKQCKPQERLCEEEKETKLKTEDNPLKEKIEMLKVEKLKVEDKRTMEKEVKPKKGRRRKRKNRGNKES